MRIAIVASLVAASMLRICGSDSDDKGKAEAELAASAKLDLNAPRIGGSVVAVGKHRVELLVFQSGLIEAAVRDAKGKALEGGAKLKVVAHAKGGAKKDVTLKWNPARARFVGDARADLVAEPLDVRLEVEGAKADAKLEGYALVVGPELGGQLVVVGDHSAEVLVDVDGKVEAIVRGAAGAELDGKAGIELEAELPTVDGKVEIVPLKWDPPSARFRGQAKGKLAPGRLKLTLAANGKAAVGAVESIALRAKAKFGGRVVMAGDYSVELVAAGKGLVKAYVFDASGARVKGDVDLRLSIGGKPVVLEWDAPSASFKGRIGAGVNLNVAPVGVAVKAGGKLHAGAVASLKADLSAAARAKARASLKGRYDIRAPEIKPPKLEANARAKAAAGAGANAKAGAKASVDITPPKVEVKKSAGAKGSFSFGTK